METLNLVFKTIIWRIRQATGQATGQVNRPFERVVLAINGEIKRQKLQEIIGLKHRETFLENYLSPSIHKGYVEMKYPDSPNHPQQKYMLTSKGKELLKKLKKRSKS